MFVAVTTAKLPLSATWGLRLRSLLAVAILVCSSTALGQSVTEAAPASSGEAWSNALGAATGTVSSSPAPAVPAPAAAPAPAAQPAQGHPAQGSPSPSPAARQPTADEAVDADPEALTMWRPHLEPYGSWVDDPRYGVIWVPRRDVVGPSFSPYVTNGHWALDNDDNWIWVSDHPFGWVVFHYGRWFYAPEVGWAWVPGRTYAPNWVVWRLPTANYAYVGWAPMPPRFGWFGGGAVWYSSYGSVSYVFCPSDYLFYPSVGLYLVHDAVLVSTLGLHTSFYYPPYYARYGYYGYYHHHHQVGRHRPPGFGPPIHRTRISRHAVPRTRVAADPRAVAAAPRRSGSGFGGFQRSPATAGTRDSAAPRSRPSATNGSRSVRSAAPERARPSTPKRERSAVPTTRTERSAVPTTRTERSSRTESAPSPAATSRTTDSPRAASPSHAPRSSGPSVRSAPTHHAPKAGSPRRSSSPSASKKRR